MIKDHDRAYWFGASDSQKILTPNHYTKTWQSWWRTKCGIEDQAFYGNKYTAAGTRFEHPILECFDKDMNLDRQLFIEDLRLRVNYDGDKNGTIYEVKTHGIDKIFEITPYIQAQCQTQMYVWQECMDDFNGLYILSYGLTEADYNNLNPTVADIDFDRIKVHKIRYKRRQVKHFLDCLEPLAEELKLHVKEDNVKKLSSIFTDNTDKCIVTGLETGIERHHVFGGADRKRSEKYSFIAPLHYSVHPNGASCSDKNWQELDHWLKRKCQEYYIEVAHIGTRDDWYREFGRFYDDRADEKVWLNDKFEWKVGKHETDSGKSTD